jgi:hypothetical protein
MTTYSPRLEVEVTKSEISPHQINVRLSWEVPVSIYTLLWSCVWAWNLNVVIMVRKDEKFVV